MLAEPTFETNIYSYFVFDAANNFSLRDKVYALAPGPWVPQALRAVLPQAIGRFLKTRVTASRRKHTPHPRPLFIGPELFSFRFRKQEHGKDHDEVGGHGEHRDGVSKGDTRAQIAD